MEVAGDLDHPVLLQRACRDLRGVHREVRAGEARDVDAVRASGTDLAAVRVVAEDDRAAQAREPADGAAEAVVEVVGGLVL